MKVMITGDSHIAALRWGLDSLVQDDAEALMGCRIDIKPLGNGGDLTRPFFRDNGDFAEILLKNKRNQAERLPVSAEDGGDYDYYALCGLLHTIRIWMHKKYWADFTPFMANENQHPVSAGLLKRIVMDDQKYLLELAELLKRVSCKLIVIEAPKPFRHHPRAQANPELIAYLDRFYRETIRAVLASKNVPVIQVPGFCYDANGFMEERYRSSRLEDTHHGNSELGAIMIKELIKFVRKGGGSE